MTDETRVLYRFHWDCGRQGDVEGLFIAYPSEIDDAIGKDIYFGEILGKHSEIHGTLDAEDVTRVSDDAERVTWLFELMGDRLSGYCPLDYLPEDDDAEEKENL